MTTKTLTPAEATSVRRFFEKAYPGANHQEVYGLVGNE